MRGILLGRFVYSFVLVIGWSFVLQAGPILDPWYDIDSEPDFSWGLESGLERPFEEQFELHDSSDSLEQAQIILLGNTHTFIEHKIWIADLIKEQASPGDYVLLEGLESMEAVEPKNSSYTLGLSEGVKVVGWDDMRDHSLTGEILAEIYLLNEEMRALRERLQEEGATQAEAERVIHISKRLSELNQEFYDVAVVDRNKSLVETIEIIREKSPGARVFVVAGSLHLTEPEVLQAYLDQHSFHTLIASSDGLIEFVSSEDYLKSSIEPHLPADEAMALRANP